MFFRGQCQVMRKTILFKARFITIDLFNVTSLETILEWNRFLTVSLFIGNYKRLAVKCGYIKFYFNDSPPYHLHLLTHRYYCLCGFIVKWSFLYNPRIRKIYIDQYLIFWIFGLNWYINAQLINVFISLKWALIYNTNSLSSHLRLLKWF